MSNSFYSKLAITNLKKNASIYIPYILTCVCTIAAFYIMSSISYNKGLGKMPGAASLQVILSMGTIVIGIFAAIFLFYTNSFLIKRRKKELGLYSILGMEKKHIAKVLTLEVIYFSIFSLMVGLFLGVVLSKFLFLLLLNILNFDVSLYFFISWKSILDTTILFLCIFFATLLSNLWQTQIVNPIELLRGGDHGEREPKTKWIMTVIGFLALGTGYYIAISVESPLDALGMFFVAVICVIIGTFGLFTAGSIAILKLIRKNKKFYYKTGNFINVSGMIYRMKQNAVGLSNICILSTMVLVVFSTTVSLYVGRQDLLKNRYPMDTKIIFTNENNELDFIEKAIKEQEEKHQVKTKDNYYYRYIQKTMQRNENHLLLYKSDVKYENICYVETILLEDYNRIEGTSETLEENQILLYSTKKNMYEDKLRIEDTLFDVKKNLESIFLSTFEDQLVSETLYIVVKDENAMKEWNTLFNQELEEHSLFSYMYNFNIDGEKEDIISFVEELKTNIKEHAEGFRYLDNMHVSEQDFYSVYGGFLFIGIFLGLLFMMATVLIIYYKQISEGYDDHERFQIMQKVGLSQKEVKKVIQKQIISVFFLPLVGALVHILFAFKVMSRILYVFNLTNVTLFAICTMVTIIVFALIYAVVYHLTAKMYYKIVQM